MIIFKSAQEIDTSTSKNKSVGVDIGVTISASGLSPNASLNLGKGNSNGRDVTNIESVLSAGGTARVVTPGALTLEGAQLSGNRVEVQAGSLAITSQQDTSVFKSKQTNVGVSVSADLKNADKSATNKSGFSGAGASLSFGQTKQSGDFASVQEQSGINAGAGGFDIKVAGVTSLTGGVIASTADAANNQLSTGTLSATDLTNREKFKASSINLSASISGIGAPRQPGGSGGNAEQVPADGKGNPSQGGNRTGTTAGLRTGIGTIAAGAPSVANASGSQSSTTVSAIATGGITVTSGDTASLGVAQTISRDTSAANEALTKQFTDAKRADIAQGFAAAQALTQQVSVFFNNRAQDQSDAEKRAIAAGVRTDERGNPVRDAQGNLIALNDAAQTAINTAGSIRNSFGAGSAARLALTAFSGAAGSNVTGSLGNLVEGAAINVLQGLATSEVKKIADSFTGTTTEREALRTALQAVVGCAGSAAGGANCASGAIGAGASVVLNNVLTSLLKDDPSATLEDQQARVNLIATLSGALASAVGGDFQAAALSAQIEAENNYLTRAQLLDRQTELTRCDDNQACVERVNTRYAELSAAQDLQVAIACQGGGLPGCSTLQDAQSDYLNGRVFGRSFGNTISFGAFGTGRIPLDDALRVDLVRSLQQSALETIAAGDIAVTALTPFLKDNNITAARFGFDTLNPNSAQAILYAGLPELFNQDQATASMTFLGRATNGQRQIAALGFAGQRDALQTIVTAEVAIGCAVVSAVCAGALTVAGGVDCVRNPSVLGCGAAAVGVAIPVVRAVRSGGAVNAGGAASAADDVVPPAAPNNLSGTGTAAFDTRAPLVPSNVTVTFENAGSRLTAAELNAGFRTAGTNIEAVDRAAGRELTAIIQSGGVSADDAAIFANRFFAAGARPPVAVPISVGDTLVKLVPRGVPVDPYSGYFLTQSELAALTRNPGQISNRLGLPAGSQALQYDVYRVEALVNTTVFQSRVASTVNTITGARTTGGATQTIVGNRGQFTDPVRVGTINAFNPLPRTGN